MNYSKIFKDNNGQIDIQAGIHAIKKAGASQLECVKVLVSELSISLREADGMVLNSDAWSEEKNDVIELRKNIDISLDKLETDGLL